MAFDGLTRDRRLEQRVLIVGTGPVARLVARQITSQHDFGYRIVGCVSESRRRRRRTDSTCRCSARAADVSLLVLRHQIDRVVVEPLRPARPSADSGAAAREAVGRPHRRRGHDLRADHRKDPDRRTLAELADLLGRLQRLAGATRVVKRAHRRRAGRRRPRARGAADAADGARRPAGLARTGLLPAGPRRRKRPALHALQVSIDAQRRRAGHADLGDEQRQSRDAGRPRSSG